MTITNNVFSAFSFIAFILVSIPFAWQLKAWNTATCLYIFWVSISNLTYFINSLVWDGNLVDWSPVWCDISGRITLGINIAIPATCLCIQRRLFQCILTPKVGPPSRAERRRFIIIDMMIGLGSPLLNITLAYFVQIQRYYILEDFGCRIPLVNTSLGIVLIPVWKLSISIISGVYGSINLYHMWIKRRTIRTSLGSSTGGLNFSRYLRLFILSGIDLLITIPLNIWAFTTWFPVLPLESWTAIHADFSRIDKIPALMWRGDPKTDAAIEVSRWIGVVYAFVFFALFGFTDGTMEHYVCALRYVAKKLGYQTGSSGSFEPQVLEHHNVRPGDSFCSSNIEAGVFSENLCFTADEPKPSGSTDDESKGPIVGLGAPGIDMPESPPQAQLTSPNAPRS